MFRLWLTPLLLIFPLLTQAADRNFYQYAEIAHSVHDPDTDELDDTYGYTLKGEIPINDSFHISGRFTDGDHVPLPEWTLSDWYSIGVGWNKHIYDYSSLYVRLTYDQAEGAHRTHQNDIDDGGVGFQVGARTLLSERWFFGLQVGQTGALMDDIQLIGEAGLALGENLMITARIRDYDDLDLTSYEVGIRIRF